MAKLGTPALTDGRLTFDVQDSRQLLQTMLPRRTYNNNGLDAINQADRGRSRALLWGRKTGIRPVQFGTHTTDGGPIPMGQYEVVDSTDWPAGTQYSPAIILHWYRDEAAAMARSEALRTNATYVASSQSVFYSWDIFGERFEIRKDGRPIVITQDNNKLYFNTGGATLTAVLTPGTYLLEDVAADGLTRIGLLADLQAAMRAVDGADLSVFLVLSTQKVRFERPGQTLNLLCKTGSNVQSGIWSILGFDASTDKTGASTYNADNVFTSAAPDQIIRVDQGGFRDDASGTYTGTAQALIEKAPDIARHILRVFLKEPAAAIDTASFVAARATTAGSKPCSLYVGVQRKVGDIFAELETSGNFDLIYSGGIWYCVPRDTSVPAGTPDLVDSDYLSFESYYEPTDLWGTVVLTYNDSPDGGTPIPSHGYRFPGRGTGTDRPGTGEVTDATVALRYGRPESKTFRTCLRDAVDATTNPARLQAIATQAQTKRRRFRLTVKGKALMTPVCGKLRLTRAKGLDTTGALNQVLVRIIRKRDDWARWISEIEAIEVI